MRELRVDLQQLRQRCLDLLLVRHGLALRVGDVRLVQQRRAIPVCNAVERVARLHYVFGMRGLRGGRCAGRLAGRLAG